jgi:hypothetical protein
MGFSPVDAICCTCCHPDRFIFITSVSRTRFPGAHLGSASAFRLLQGSLSSVWTGLVVQDGYVSRSSHIDPLRRRRRDGFFCLPPMRVRYWFWIARLTMRNKRARGGGGIPVLFHDGRSWADAPQHDRWAITATQRMHPALTKARDGYWIRQALWFCAVFIAAFALYCLSVGPVLKLCGAKPSTGWSGLPTEIQFIYTPLRDVPEPLARVLDHYVEWWIGVQ